MTKFVDITFLVLSIPLHYFSKFKIYQTIIIRFLHAEKIAANQHLAFRYGHCRRSLIVLVR